MKVRKPVGLGTFYPRNAAELARVVDRLLEQASERILPGCPAALVVPHAGYAFSGPVAASGFVQLIPHAAELDRVVLLGPSHYCAFTGVAICEEDEFATPLGEIPVEEEQVRSLVQRHLLVSDSAMHRREHCLEVELPFLQKILPRFRIVPMVTGETEPWAIADLLEDFIHDRHTVVLVSTDLSHYFSYAEARHWDRLTRLAIENLDEEALKKESACGRTALAGLLCLARRHGWSVRCLDLRNSGDICGDRRQVVGYGAWAFYDHNQERINEGHHGN